MVRITQPPPQRPPRPILLTLPGGARLVRLFDPTSFGATALGFRAWGPVHRFDHQRGNPPGVDPDRRIYYAADTLSGCLVEVFGDTGIVTTGEWHVAFPTTTRDLLLLDLRGPGAMRAGTVAAIAKHADRADTQTWSRFFYDEPAFAGIDGLVFFNAHNDETAYALYERAEGALTCPPGDIVRLDAPALRDILLDIMDENNLTF